MTQPPSPARRPPLAHWRVLKTILQPVYTVWVILVFTAGLLVSLPIVAVLSIRAGTRARRRICCVLRAWSWCFLACTGMLPRFVGQRPGAGRYVVVANHISYLDPVLLFPAIPFYFRALGKTEIGRAPLFGFIYRQIVVLIDRSTAMARARSMLEMQRALKTEGSIALFPEGTFNETATPLKEFFDGAFRLAIGAGVPVLPVLFPDTPKRWHYSSWWKMWPGKARIHYLPAVSTEGLTNKDISRLKDEVFRAMEEVLRGYDYPPKPAAQGLGKE